MPSVLAALAIFAQGPLLAGPVPNNAWLRRPSSEDMVRYYPEPAAKRGLSGRVVMICDVAAQGALTACRVDSELPKGEGFGEAALRTAPLFKLHPSTASGDTVEGGVIRIPLRFVMAPVIERQEKLIAAMTCYGHVADLADRAPKAAGAWQATVYWSMEVAAASANIGLRPVDFEDALAIARREVSNRKAAAPDGELDACLAKGKPQKR